ncbi:MAG: hypothetical protein JRI59_04970, partial [Deltaproteobacteria bacterium]|nr:hypothetical protein [Deltaproteobacteria bacterium]
AAEIISILDGSAPERDLARQLVQDILTLAEETPRDKEGFFTRTAQRLAEAASR